MLKIPINYVKPFLRKSGGRKQGRKFSQKDFARVEFPPDNISLGFDQESRCQLYVIRPRDTLYSLAQRFNTSVEKLMTLNELSDSKIYRGQTIKVPVNGGQDPESGRGKAGR